MSRWLTPTVLTLALLAAGAGRAQTGSPASGVEILARSGPYSYSSADFAVVLGVYQTVLEASFDSGARAQLQEIGVSQFQAKPQEVAQGMPQVRALLAALRSGSPVRQAALREFVWQRLIQQASSDRFAAATLGVMRGRARIVAEGDGLIVTQPELNALFATEDDLAQLGGVAKPTAAQRASIQAMVASRFASLSKADQEPYAHAETRRAALLAHMPRTAASHDRLVAEVRQAAGAPGGLEQETRKLEDKAVQLQIAESQQGANLTPEERAQLAAFNKRMWSQSLAIMGFSGDSATLQAEDRAVTQFNSRTYTAPHNAH